MVQRPSERIRVALVGYGFAGKTFHAPLIKAVDGLELCLVASRDPARVQADCPGVAVTADPMQAVADAAIDLVVIASPNATHAPLAVAALEAGKHVVVDKPFTLDLAEARTLVAMAARSDRLLAVFHNRRWDSDFLGVRQAIEAGVVGTVKHFESHIDRFRPDVRDRWRERSGPGAGLLFDLGPHLIDQALQLFGLPDRVTANLASLRLGAPVDDWFHLCLDYPARRVVLHASMIVAGGSPRFMVHGDSASLVKRDADRQERQLLAGMMPGADGWGVDPDPLQVYPGDGGAARTMTAPAGDQRHFYRRVVDALRRGRPHPVRPIEALAVMACLDAAVASASNHASMMLALDQDERVLWMHESEPPQIGSEKPMSHAITSIPLETPLPPDDPSRHLTVMAPDDANARHLAQAGGIYTVLVSGDQTDGRYCLIDMLVPEGGGPPPHRHDFEEMFTLLEGELSFTFRGETTVVKAPATVNIPANAPHFFKNTSGATVHMLCMCTPAGQDAFFMAVADPVADRTLPPPTLSPDERAERGKTARALAKRFRTEFLV